MAVALAVLAGIVVAVPGARSAAPAPLFEEIGALDRFPADARVALGPDFVPTWEQASGPQGTPFSNHREYVDAIVLPRERQLWQIYPGTGSSAAKTGIVVRDLDTMRIVGTLRLDESLERATRVSGGDWAHAVDTAGHRLFLVTDKDRAVLEIDVRTFAVVRRPLPAGFAGREIPVVVGATTYDPYSKSLLLLFGGPPSTVEANFNTFLYTLDVSGPPAGGPAAFRQMRACTGPLSSTDTGGDTYNWEILVTEDHLYVPCQRLGHTGIVVRTTRTAEGGAVPPEDVAAGPFYVENNLADQAAKRLVMTTAEREIWTFEAATMSFAGVVATGPAKAQGKTGYGLDTETGRVFYQSPNFGLGVVEARFFPLPQARRVDHRAPGRERILSDARTNRVFVLEGASPGEKVRAYRVYRVQPAPRPPAAADPDRNTADVDEKQGVTEVRFNASASGYGARVLWVQGFATIPPAPPFGVFTPTADAMLQASPACGFTDREFTAGRVFRSEYDTGTTSAQAVAFEVDDNTKQDLDKPSHCDVDFAPLDQFAEQKDDPKTPQQETRWQWRRADCSSSQGETDTTRRTGKGEAAHFGPSSVSCPEPGRTLTAHAEAGGPDRGALSGPDSPVSVGRAYTATKVEPVASGGVRSTVTSVAQDVRLNLPGGPSVAFAEIRATATSFSNGRPKRADMSDYEISIRGARIGARELCTELCPSPNLTEVVDALNTAASGRALFRTGAGTNSGLDRSLLAGSRGGAQTAVQKAPVRRASDRALTGDFTVEVPGLEVITFNDNTRWGRARQLYQFAGVASSATYNIVLPPSDVPFADLGPFEGPLGDVGADEDASVEATGFEGFEGFEGDTADGTASFAGGTVAALRDTDEDPGGFWAPLRAVARGLRLFLTDPRHSLLLLTAWALLGLPGALSRRRRLLAGVGGG